MSTPYSYPGGYQPYSPPSSNCPMNGSPIFHEMQYHSGNNGPSSSSSSSTGSSVISSYSLHDPRLRYYLSKSFDAEDDLEFCPEIPEAFSSNCTSKKFNPYTASVFSPTPVAEAENFPPQTPVQRVLTPRAKKIIEIINPHTKIRVGSPASNK